MSNMTTPPDDKQTGNASIDSAAVVSRASELPSIVDDNALATSDVSKVTVKQFAENPQAVTSEDMSQKDILSNTQAQASISTSSTSTSSGVSTATVAEKNMGEKSCQNCGFELDGPFCGRCGQPERSTIKFFGSVILHFLDDIFGFDSRAGRTILPLIFRPGFLSCEYFRGRRVHYVPPLRLYFFVSIVFFLMLELFTGDSVSELKQLQQANAQGPIANISTQITTLENKMSGDNYQHSDYDQRQLENLRAQKSLAKNDILSQVSQLKEKVAELNPKQLPFEQLPIGDQMAIKGLQQTINVLQMNLNEHPNFVGVEIIQNKLIELDKAQQKINAQPVTRAQSKTDTQPLNDNRLPDSQLKQREALEAQLIQLMKEDANISTPEGSESKKSQFNLNIKPNISWLSSEQNKQIELFLADMEQKAKVAFEQDATPLVNQVLGVLPQMMFFLLPIFALILKIFYLFSKRFYMEHLTVALHSHAFIFVVLMILAIVSSFYQYLPVEKQTALDISEGIVVTLVIWMPIYLFLMQKKVYRQGIFMTLCKYFVVGITYVMLLITATLIAFFWGLAHT